MSLGVGVSLQKDPKTVLRPSFRIKYTNIDQKSSALLTSPLFTSADYSQQSGVSLDEDRYGIGFGLDFSRQVSDRLSLGGSLGIDLMHYKHGMQFNQYNICGACGGGSPEASYDVMLNQNNNGWTTQANLELNAKLKLQKSWSLGLGVGWDYYGSVARLDSRDNPDEPDARLDSDGTDAWFTDLSILATF